jgi:hypothetical protein
VEAETVEQAGKRLLTLLCSDNPDVPFAAQYLAREGGWARRIASSRHDPEAVVAKQLGSMRSAAKHFRAMEYRQLPDFFAQLRLPADLLPRGMPGLAGAGGRQDDERQAEASGGRREINMSFI